ncbi:MAG: hypothetical protein Tp185DCM00d2C31949991_12 [Prokaryotic dsDNA virus sp.]|nr:MAG: hypothetical protein Tp162SUR1511541_58 [Prokaryotic dsDNA virus sp.]QDP56724.1 MAG: hypothetical protein Tp185DCM00d2C31949991_12 [Prokaryotic dsDNA virus sp.]QDP63758.1 MAG: hypothetical protein Unbinned2480contig1002_12 [Prokaryotic dsDNA virus sp.]QDP63828.1 MAG: hypothetical protein GOVbin2429_12 [Prokaryotic dsDNA virus sp.]|tara:strand:+ start:36985 stop:37308 length:324 start_codon:yes stop_codon:yes gene_type:complete
MITTHATKAAEAATNINREDWINGATDLVMSGEYQYDRSTWNSKEAFISLDNVMEDVMGMDEVKKLLVDWLQGGECCDYRDQLNNVVSNVVRFHLWQMADDFNVGVR